MELKIIVISLMLMMFILVSISEIKIIMNFHRNCLKCLIINISLISLNK